MESNITGITGQNFIQPPAAHKRQIPQAETGGELPHDEVTLTAQRGSEPKARVGTPVAAAANSGSLVETVSGTRPTSQPVPLTITQLDETSAVRRIGEGTSLMPTVTLGVIKAAEASGQVSQQRGISGQQVSVMNDWYLNS